ncbi:MAG: amidohydrolase family protein [Dehalococcoidia bacterium]|jgi:predicted TIM-barrel fold metal-dependent hydrolase
MIIDFHTHVFPTEVHERRDELLQLEPCFSELYARHDSRLATADDLLRSMDGAGIDVSVVLNFAWHDAALCRRTNDYILESAAAGGGRLIPFCIFAPGDISEIERCLASGARGFGELRPESQGWDLSDEALSEPLGRLASESGAVLLFHASEPVGPAYAGKEGQSLASLYRFIERWPAAKVVAAHWGGGLPFYKLMRRAHETLANTYFDTAATRFLYRHEVFRRAVDIVGAERVLFGSDFPLLPQSRCRQEVDEAQLSDAEKALILGENARRLLGL